MPHKSSNGQILTCNDANAQSVNKSISNDLEDAEGKLRLCKSAIHKGQMFLHFLSAGILTGYLNTTESEIKGKPRRMYLEVVVPPPILDVKHCRKTATYSKRWSYGTGW